MKKKTHTPSNQHFKKILYWKPSKPSNIVNLKTLGKVKAKQRKRSKKGVNSRFIQIDGGIRQQHP